MGDKTNLAAWGAALRAPQNIFRLGPGLSHIGLSHGSSQSRANPAPFHTYTTWTGSVSIFNPYNRKNDIIEKKNIHSYFAHCNFVIFVNAFGDRIMCEQGRSSPDKRVGVVHFTQVSKYDILYIHCLAIFSTLCSQMKSLSLFRLCQFCLMFV